MAGTAYSPEEFLRGFGGILLTHTGVHTVRLRLPEYQEMRTRSESESCVTVCADFLSVPQLTEKQSQRNDCDGDLFMKHADQNALVAAFRIVATRPDTQLTARWCAELQRVCCIQSFLVYPTLSKLSSAARAPISFEVCLFPYVPQLSWSRALDGVLGSQQHCLVTATILPPSSSLLHTEADDAPAAVCSGGKRSRSNGDDSHHNEGDYYEDGAACPSKRSDPNRDSIAGRSFPCRVGALLNANVPLGPRCADGSGRAALLVMHAPHAQLTTATLPMAPPSSVTTERSRHGGRGGHHDTMDYFSFMKYVITHHVRPLLSLDEIGAVWDDVQGVLGSNSGSGKALVSKAASDDVCGVSAIATSYYFKPAEKKNASSLSSVAETRVKNVVLIIDVPPQMWEALYDDWQCAQTGDGKKCAHLVDGAAVQIAAVMAKALLQLASNNLDIFMFSRTQPRLRQIIASSSAATCTAEGGAPDGKPSAEESAVSASYCSRPMLARSIAESIAAIVSSSPHDDFVKAVEDLLFDGPPADTAASSVGRVSRRRYSDAEIRWAVETKLQ